MSNRLKIGTLSSELQGAEMKLARNGGLVRIIINALEEHRPDVLLTAGYSLDSGSDLDKLKEYLDKSNWNGLLFVEIKRYDGGLSTRLKSGIDLSDHCLFAWTSANGMKRMGRQYFATRKEMCDIEAGKPRVDAFEGNLQERVIEFRGLRFGALICGEINALQGRNEVAAITDKIQSWIESLHVVVNATHDRMGNGGTLKAKRSWISQGNRNKAYISASNWNTSKGQKKDSRTLHTIYVDGKETPQSRLSAECDYEYRDAIIELHEAHHLMPDKASSKPKGKASVNFWRMLKTVFPDVQCECQFSWLTLPIDNSAAGIEREVLDALIQHCQTAGQMQKNIKKRDYSPEQLSKKLNYPARPKLEFDFYIPSRKIAFEFDERQHFTAERAASLLCYKDNSKVKTYFDVQKWIKKCDDVKANDADPIWRDWYRAYRDSVRDIRAAQNGVALFRIAYDDPVSKEWLVELTRLNHDS